MLEKLSKDVFVALLPERERDLARVSTHETFSEFLGNFTVVVIRGTFNSWAGVSKRNPIDSDNCAGLRIAAVRAWRNRVERDPGYSRQRLVTKREAKRASMNDIIDNVLALGE